MVTRLGTKTAYTRTLCGTWHNQHNSEIHLEIDKSGKVTGFFRTALTAEGLQEFPLTGFAVDDVIGFCVRFQNHACVTCWSGHLAAVPGDGATEALHTLWHMTVEVGKTEEEKLWKSTIAGSDTFVRGPRKSMVAGPKTPASHPLWLNPDSQASAY